MDRQYVNEIMGLVEFKKTRQRFNICFRKIRYTLFIWNFFIHALQSRYSYERHYCSMKQESIIKIVSIKNIVFLDDIFNYRLIDR